MAASAHILLTAALRYTGAAVAMSPDSLPPEVVEALKLGRPIEAIKRLRKSTGIGLAEAKAIVDAFSAGKTAYQSPGQAGRKQKRPAPAGDPGRPPEPVVEPSHEIMAPPDLLMPRQSGLGQGEVPNSNSGFWWVLFLAFVALVGYFILER